MKETNLFEEAIKSGGEGLIGADASGLDWEFSQNIGSSVVEELVTLEEVEQ